MASDSDSGTATTTPTDAADKTCRIRFQRLPLIDLRLFTQSELYSLSLRSVASPSPSSQDDVVVPIPKIDRSVFNESAGSRRQTYFRLRLAPRTNSNHPHPTAAVSRQNTLDPFEEENSRIISLLKALFVPHADPKLPVPDSPPEDGGGLIVVPVSYDECVPDSSSSVLQNIPIGVVGLGLGNQKRGRPIKLSTSPPSFENLSEEKESPVRVDNEGEQSNKKRSLGVAGDLDRLEDELRWKTEGMRTEEELSGFLRGLSGEWGSRRKKRKIVDARSFGDVLPIGWKLLLSIKNHGDQAWLGCSRYISPDGQQFVSSEDVFAHLYGFQDATQEASCPANESSLLVSRTTTEDSAGPSLQNNVICLSAVPISSIPANHHKEVLLPVSGILDKFEMKGRYRCHKCTMTFEEKDNLLLHLLSSHKKSRNVRNGAADSDSIIMKDGKYECQLCHKLFEEKNRFSSHFGNHIKDYVRRVEASGETDCVHRRTPKVSEPTSGGAVSIAVPENCEAFESSTLHLSSAKLEFKAISKTQPSPDGHRIHTSTAKPVALSEKDGEGVAHINKKQERNADLSNANAGVVGEACKIDADLDISKDTTALLSVVQDNGTSEIPEKTSSFENANEVSMGSIKSLEECREGMVPLNGILAQPENNNAQNNESLVNSLFGSPMEDMDMDNEDGIGDNGLIPGIEDRCFGVQEGVTNGSLHEIRSQGCSLEFGHEENCNKSDVMSGTQNCLPQNERVSENHELSSSEVLSPNVNHGKVSDNRLGECGSYNSWKSENAINVGQVVVERAVQQADTSFPVIQAVDQQACNVDATGFSSSNLQNPWQQKNFESNLVSVHQKSLSPDANMGKVPSSTMRNIRTFADTQPDTAVLGRVEKQISSAVTLPVTLTGQQAFSLNNDDAHKHTFSKPKEYSRFAGLYAGEQNCADKNDGCLTVSNAANAHKKEELMSCNWTNKSPSCFGSQYPLQHGGPVLGFEAWANPPSRSSEAVTPEHGGTTFLGTSVDQLKQNKESAFGLPSPSVDRQQESVTSYNLHMFYGSMIPDDGQVGNMGFFGNNGRTISLYNQQQPKESEEAVTQSMLRMDQNVDILQNSSLNYIPPSAAQPSDCFPTFNMATEKAQHEFYTSNQKLGNVSAVVEGTRTNAGEGFMEYNFLSAPSSGQGNHISLFNRQIGQGFETKWGEKEALGLFPKIGSGGSSSSGTRHHQVTALCVWCGNQFSHDSSLDVGDGSVGYMCFNCKAKFPGQINFF
ncbi:hypothetical protein SAY87_012416 [Trapa incisa]|uniref:C2H2-type domain-containing protein n=1 Tax=Trapa incisa TaxID=236973 RepID=A0AAN7GQ86_9MYRT|nr:hypothetical protein SAY87_012416 [Trapa incisa]